MIYLRYRYKLSKLPEPVIVAIFVNDSGWVKNEVRSEFEVSFSASKILLNPPLYKNTNMKIDIAVLVYRQNALNLQELVAWSQLYSSYVELALGFYCVDQRMFEVVRLEQLKQWRRRKKMMDWVVRWFQRHPALWRILKGVIRQCEFLL